MTVGVTTWEPEVDFEPVQAPPAEHDDVLVEDQERVDDPPEVIDVGEANKERVGALTVEELTTRLKLNSL